MKWQIREWIGFPGLLFLLLFFLVHVPACSNTFLGLQGSVAPRRAALGTAGGKPPWGYLTIDELGNLALNGQVLSLPAAQENRRFGVIFVDASALPVIWRPRHAKEGGPMVASIERASPLALAGLRPFDVVKGVQGQLTGDADSLVKALKEVLPGAEVRLDAETPRGSRVIVAREAGDFQGDFWFSLPFVFQYQKTPTAFLVRSTISDCWSRVRYGNPEPETPGELWPTCYREFKLDPLAGIITYRSNRNLDRGVTKKELELLTFPIKKWTTGGPK